MPVLQPLSRSNQSDLKRIARKFPTASSFLLGNVAPMHGPLGPAMWMLLGPTTSFQPPRKTSRPRGAQEQRSKPPRNGTGAKTSALTAAIESLDHNPGAKLWGGRVAQAVGAAPGVARGAWHTAEDLKDAAVFLSRLQNPALDLLLSPPGETAYDEISGAAEATLDYFRKKGSPSDIKRDIGQALEKELHRQTVRLSPLATPQAETFSGELRRGFEIGKNQGELAFDVASFAYGGAELKAWRRLNALRKLTTAERVAMYEARGFGEQLARYFAEKYIPKESQGMHLLPQRLGKPSKKRRWTIPKRILDSPFNVVKPQNVDRGTFLEMHRGTDQFAKFGRVPKRHGGGGWSAEKLGWETYGLLDRVVYGTPLPLKLTAGAGLVGAGALVADNWTDGNWAAYLQANSQ